MIAIYLEVIYNIPMENTRICNNCKIIKSFSLFHWDKINNIPKSICKLCYNAQCKKYRKSKAGKQTYRKWVTSLKGKKVRHNAITKWRELNAIKRSAHTAVSNALRDKRLTKLPCCKCGKLKSEAHHTSYEPEDWLKVIWFCKKHHSEITFKDE